MTIKLKQVIALSSMALLLGGFVAVPTIAHAAAGDTSTGNTSLTLTGDAGALSLDTVPSFDWGSMTTTAATSVNSVAGTGNLQVTDGRGGSTGYAVTAQASDLTASGVTLPVQTMTLTTTGVTHLTGVSDVDILSTGTIVTGDKDSNGTLAITETTGKISVANTAKTGSYTGTITYTIVDGGL